MSDRLKADQFLLDHIDLRSIPDRVGVVTELTKLIDGIEREQRRMCAMGVRTYVLNNPKLIHHIEFLIDACLNAVNNSTTEENK